MIALAERAPPRVAARPRRDPNHLRRRRRRADHGGRRQSPRGALIDLSADDYVELALGLGHAPDRIDTIVDFAAKEEHGVKGDGGAAAASAATLAELAEAIAAGDLVVPIQRTYPLDDVRAAFAELEAGHVAGKDRPHPLTGELALGQIATVARMLGGCLSTTSEGRERDCSRPQGWHARRTGGGRSVSSACASP